MKEALTRAGRYLKEKGMNSPFLDAEVLLAHVLGLDRAGLYRQAERTLREAEEEVFDSFISRRGRREPVAYLTGSKEFMGLTFYVDRSVLIPRPETELLVETALTLLSGEKNRPLIVVEAGTGSGAVAVSLAVLLPSARVYATDCSASALAVARRNVIAHGVGERVMLFTGDLLEPLDRPGLAGRVDLIAANLPYIASGELPGLAPEVSFYEPRVALDGGADGLDRIRRLIPAVPALLKPGGWLLMEIGEGQGEAVAALMPGPAWEVKVQKDLAGWDRLVVGRLTNRRLDA